MSSGGESTRVVLVDDHVLFRNGLREILADDGVEVVGEAGDAPAGLELCQSTQPDVLVMDLRMPGMSGIEATAELRRRPHRPAVLMLTISGDDLSVIDAIRAGASGYVLKDAPAGHFARAVRAVADGQFVLSPEVARTVADRLGAAADQYRHAERVRKSLSERELEVLRLLAAGKENSEIAAELYISAATVKNHVAAVLTKLDAQNRVEAAASAVRAGLV